MKLTKRDIDAAVPAKGKPYYIWDGALSGFGVKILTSGNKKYLIKYRSHEGGRCAQQRWLTIGSVDQISLDQARKQAQQILAAVASGEDPQSERFSLREAPTLSDLWRRFEEGELKQKKALTQRDYRSNWSGLIEPKLGHIKVQDLSRSMVSSFHRKLLQTPYRANRALALLSKLMTLTESELRRLGQAMTDLVEEGVIWPDMANAITLLLLTGARKSEILSLEWGWVHLDQHMILLPDSKTGKKLLYLSNASVELLELQRKISRHPDSIFVFPGRDGDKPLVNISKPWTAICERAELEGVRLHDLRHTHASIAVGQGVGLPIIGKLLGHSQTQTTARYAHVDSVPALQAVNTVGDVITGAVQRKP